MGRVLEQNLGQIRSNVLKKVRKLSLSIGFSHILHGEYILKQEARNATNIARNATFKGH